MYIYNQEYYNLLRKILAFWFDWIWCKYFFAKI